MTLFGSGLFMRLWIFFSCMRCKKKKKKPWPLKPCLEPIKRLALDLAFSRTNLVRSDVVPGDRQWYWTVCVLGERYHCSRRSHGEAESTLRVERSQKLPSAQFRLNECAHCLTSCLGYISTDGLSSDFIKEARICSATKIRIPNVSKHGIFLSNLEFFWETVGRNPGTISIAIDVNLVDILNRTLYKIPISESHSGGGPVWRPIS